VRGNVTARLDSPDDLRKGVPRKGWLRVSPRSVLPPPRPPARDRSDHRDTLLAHSWAYAWVSRMLGTRAEHGADECPAVTLTTKLASGLCWQRGTKSIGPSSSPRAADPAIAVVARGEAASSASRLTTSHSPAGPPSEDLLHRKPSHGGASTIDPKGLIG
jgi:hypothetical protein